ncbi:hypothetical protein V496_09975 [Pseudogymnoascus sp. VKM F-4515 (FW-2607)]|nr:hypothetical protein V496_09975 [Pseudogymnoascus sp. VKM F-4515 (FW-2607)]
MAFPNFLTELSSRVQSINPFSAPPNLPAFYPAIDDVLSVKAILQSLALPLELTDAIIDFAEYWPLTSTVVPPGINPAHAQGNVLENYFIARTLPLGCLPSSPSTDPSRAPAPPIQGRITPHPFPPTQSQASKKSTAALYSAWAQASQPREAHPCRKIVFRFRSRDQGWGGDSKDRGTYNGSFTWLDVGKERARVVNENEIETSEKYMELPQQEAQQDEGSEGDVEKTFAWNLESVVPPPKKGRVPEGSQAGLDLGDRLPPTVELEHPFLPHDMTLQKNRTATNEARDYTIIWRWDDNIDAESDDAEELQKVGRGKATGNGEFVRSLEVGDVVTLWARARFPGWFIKVKDVEIDMFWAV